MRGIKHWMLLDRLAAKNPRETATYLLSMGVRSPVNSETTLRTSIEAFVLDRFYGDDVGRAYGLDRQAKEELVKNFRRNVELIPSGTAWLYHLVLAHEIVNIPREVDGDVIECGVWKGASTASLSLVCRAVGRKLIVSDSFEGLPDDDSRVTHQYPHLGVYGYYRKGMYAGRLDEVKGNIERCGDLSVCQFVPGFFSESLNVLKGPIAFAFLDVDLLSSMKDCVRHIWPLLVEGGVVYTDDSCDMEVVRLWFDDEWWKREIGERAPGYVGSGCGLPLDPNITSLGYIRKLHDPEQSYARVPWLFYPDLTPQGPYFPEGEPQ
jgi:O-methyltransferase